MSPHGSPRSGALLNISFRRSMSKVQSCKEVDLVKDKDQKLAITGNRQNRLERIDGLVGN